MIEDDSAEDDNPERVSRVWGDLALPNPVRVDDLVPEARWFWWSTMHYCVPQCCGLEAYSFTVDSVRYACGLDVAVPPGSLGYREAAGEPLALAADLRSAADQVRALNVGVVTAVQFNEILAPEVLAELFEDLAEKLEAVVVER